MFYEGVFVPEDSERYEPFPSFEEFVKVVGFDPTAFDPFATNFKSLKDEVGKEALERSVATATRWAAVNTGAIEGLYEVDRGFTYSVAVSASALDNAHLQKGQDVQNKINDAMAGYEYVLDVATSRRPATENWIKELHSKICASQETHTVLTEAGWQEQALPKGVYKKHPNNPMNLESGRIHAYAPPEDTPVEMARLVDALRSDEFQAAHPIVQAAYAHYAFVCIHPFADGNGRVSRALASTYLYRSPGIPLVIFADQKGQYIKTLEDADAGMLAAFVAFIRDCALDIIGMVSEDMRRPPRPTPAERIQRLQTALIAPQGVTHEEMDALGGRIVEEWVVALADAIEHAGIAPPLKVEMGRGNTNQTISGYRPGNEKMLSLNGSSAAPAQATRNIGYRVGIPVASRTPTADFVLLRQGVPLTEVALREVHPIITTAFRYRLSVLAEDQVSEFVDDLAASAEENLRKRGFIS